MSSLISRAFYEKERRRKCDDRMAETLHSNRAAPGRPGTGPAPGHLQRSQWGRRCPTETTLMAVGSISVVLGTTTSIHWVLPAIAALLPQPLPHPTCLPGTQSTGLLSHLSPYRRQLLRAGGGVSRTSQRTQVAHKSKQLCSKAKVSKRVRSGY